MYTTPNGQIVRRHPIRGFFWGLLMGLGIAVLLIVTNVVAIGTLAPVLVVVFSVAFGIVWGLFAPPRKAKGDPHLPVEPAEPAQPVEPEVAVAAAEVDASPEMPAQPVQPVEPMTPEQTMASRETVVRPGEPAEHGGTVVDSPTDPDEPAD